MPNWTGRFFPSFLYFQGKTAFGTWEVESCFYATLPVGSEITVSIVKCVARSVLFCKWDRGAFREQNCCLLTWIFEWNCLTWQWNIWNTEPSTFLNFVKLRWNHAEKCKRKVVYAEPNRTGWCVHGLSFSTATRHKKCFISDHSWFYLFKWTRLVDWVNVFGLVPIV